MFDPSGQGPPPLPAQDRRGRSLAGPAPPRASPPIRGSGFFQSRTGRGNNAFRTSPPGAWGPGPPCSIQAAKGRHRFPRRPGEAAALLSLRHPRLLRPSVAPASSNWSPATCAPGTKFPIPVRTPASETFPSVRGPAEIPQDFRPPQTLSLLRPRAACGSWAQCDSTARGTCRGPCIVGRLSLGLPSPWSMAEHIGHRRGLCRSLRLRAVRAPLKRRFASDQFSSWMSWLCR